MFRSCFVFIYFNDICQTNFSQSTGQIFAKFSGFVELHVAVDDQSEISFFDALRGVAMATNFVSLSTELIFGDIR